MEFLQWGRSATTQGVIQVYENVHWSLFYTAIIMGSGFASALLFGSMPVALILQGPIAGFTVGSFVGTALTSTVAQAILGAGKKLINKAEAENVRGYIGYAMGIAFIAASIFAGFHALIFLSKPLISNWIVSSLPATQIPAIDILLDIVPSIGEAITMGFSPEAIRVALQVGTFTLGAVSFGALTWFRRASKFNIPNFRFN